MDAKALKAIMEVMEQIQDEFSIGKDDFDKRLGRQPKKEEIMIIEGKPEDDDYDMEDDDEMGSLRGRIDMEDDEDEGDDFASRLKRLRK